MISREDLAKLCSVSYAHLNVVMRRDNMPVLPYEDQGKQRFYHAEDVHKFLDAYFKEQYGNLDDEINLDHEKARLTKYQADREELKLSVLRGRLCKIDFVTTAWERLLYAFKASLLSSPSRLCVDLANINDPDQVKKLMVEDIDNALKELSSVEYLEGIFSEAIVETASEVGIDGADSSA